MYNIQQLNMDRVWLGFIDESEKGQRYTFDWYQQHTITKELLNCGLLNGRVLDIGCGLGYRSYITHQQSECEIVGLDNSEVAIDFAQRNFKGDGLQFCVGDVLDIPFKDDSFDNAFMLGVIEHVVDTKGLLSEIKRVLKNKGRLFLSVTENNYHAHVSHVHTFSRVSLKNAFQDFEVLKCYVRDHIIFMLVQWKGVVK